MRHRLAAIVLVPLVAVTAGTALASPRSQELVREGTRLLDARKFGDALARFQQAAAVDPSDAEAAAATGVALNRLGGARAALTWLRRAEGMGSVRADLPIEIGVALLGDRRWSDAVAEFERHEQLRPGSGRARVFLGAAHLGLGDLDRARALLDEGLARDPSTKATVLYFRALVERARGDVSDARTFVARLLAETPGAPLARLFRSRVERLGAVLAAPTGGETRGPSPAPGMEVPLLVLDGAAVPPVRDAAGGPCNPCPASRLPGTPRAMRARADDVVLVAAAHAGGFAAAARSPFSAPGAQAFVAHPTAGVYDLAVFGFDPPLVVAAAQ